MFRFVFILSAMLLATTTIIHANPMIEEFEAQLEEADRQGVTGPEIEQLRQLLEQVKADEAKDAAYADSMDDNSSGASMDEGSSAPSAENAANNNTLTYTSSEGEDKSVNVDKSQLENYAGVYANEHRDPAVADFRYTLRADGSAMLEHRVCENCTHELSGEASSRDWQIQYEAIEWAPMVTETGSPMMRSTEDMNGEAFDARVLIVTLQGGKVMSLNHYRDAKGDALGGPYGVPRYRQ
ncbi:hypothetical protein [Halopseudomonas salina]|uniref:Uncharacterized protein n=1 Tax=Halopseudomonas salina TaxID=1323744 RepID=A0ABQ1PCS0_9GAMM|nr:hypothetical protein [Halopseudomonas salina]GGC94709.1 hypothetical protein GCM10007418_12850 [Halopseudomonas salina]